MIRPWEDGDLGTVAALLRASDDSRVVSPAGLRHSHATRPERAQVVELVAELEGVVVATGDVEASGAGSEVSSSITCVAWVGRAQRPSSA